jgi:cysteinyl-tRNA synthetase
MAMKYLGNRLDLHGGGLDLIFPHHENELAQSEAATGEDFVEFWVQNGLVLLGGEKMSKSTKHFFLIEDVCARVEPRVIRFYLLSTHFRSPIEFSEDRLEEAAQALGRLTGALDSVAEAIGPMEGPPKGPITPERAGSDEAREAIREFNEAMDDDFNSAKATGHLFELVRALNRWSTSRETPETRLALSRGRDVLVDLASDLGIDLTVRAEICVPTRIEDLVRLRTEARARRDWAEADRLRKEIASEGYVLEDKVDRTIVRSSRP